MRGLNLSKFKKVSGDDTHSVMKSPEGHSIRIEHRALKPEFRDALKALPISSMGKEDKAAAKSLQASANPMPTSMMADGGKVKPKKMADGGDPGDASSKDITINVGQPNAPLPENLINPQAGQLAANIAQSNGAPYMAPPGSQAPDLYGVDPEDYAKQVIAQNTPKTPEMRAPSSNATTPGVGTTQAPPNDPWGTQAYLGRMSAADQEMQAGLTAKAKAEQQVGAEEAAKLRQSIATQQQQQQTYSDNYDQLNTERQAFQQDLMNNHIDPNHYLNSMGTQQKIFSTIGLLAGGIGSAITHQANPALTFLQSQIDNDIKAQQINLGKKEGLLSANMRQFGNLRDATDMTRVMQSDIVSNQIKLAAAQAASPMAKANLLQAAAKWDQQMAPIMSQIAMRRTLLASGNNGTIPPEQVIRMIVPENENNEAMKQLQQAQIMNSTRDNLLGAFDKVSSMTLNGMFSPNQKHALLDPLVANLSKETAGRLTPQDVGMIEALMPATTDGAGTNQVKREQLDKFLTEKMKFPILTKYGIDPFQKSRYGAGAQKKIQLGPVAQ